MPNHNPPTHLSTLHAPSYNGKCLTGLTWSAPQLAKYSNADKKIHRCNAGNKQKSEIAPSLSWSQPPPEESSTVPRNDSDQLIVPDIDTLHPDTNPDKMAIDPLNEEDYEYGEGSIIGAASRDPSQLAGNSYTSSSAFIPSSHDHYESRHTDTDRSAAAPYKTSASAVYSTGRRSYRLLSKMSRMRGQVSMKSVAIGASMIMSMWENASNNGGKPNPTRTSQLINYMAGVLIRAAASPLAYLASLYYIDKLRRLYPKANGEAGCSNRIFNIALMVAIKYHEIPLLANAQARLKRNLESHPTADSSQQALPPSLPLELTHLQRLQSLQTPHYWSRICGRVFGSGEIVRMETEFIAFLKHDLYIPFVDFEYFVENTMNLDLMPIVPTSHDWSLDCISTSLSTGDFGVPEVMTSVTS